MAEQTGARVVEVKVFRAGGKLFSSSGWSHVKVTRDGDVEYLKLPIKSSGLTEVLDKLKEREPKPPITPQLVTWDSPVGRMLKWPQGKKDWVRMPDLGDEDYLKEREAFDRENLLETIHLGLAIDFEDAQGKPVTDRDGKIRILEEMGLSSFQFSQLAEDINALTTMSESDRESFFAKPSASARTASTSPNSTSSVSSLTS